MWYLIKPYRPEHAFEILEQNIRNVDLQLSNVMDWEAQCREWAKHPSFTLVVDDELVACGGVVDIGYNRGEAWILFSKLIYKYPVACFRATRKALEEILKKKDYQRLQAFVKTDHDQGKRFAERFGFKHEGDLRGYGPNGETMSIYARTS